MHAFVLPTAHCFAAASDLDEYENDDDPGFQRMDVVGQEAALGREWSDASGPSVCYACGVGCVCVAYFARLALLCTACAALESRSLAAPPTAPRALQPAWPLLTCI